MSAERKSTAGSFRDHIDELLSRLSHEGVVGSGIRHPTRSGGDEPDERQGRHSPAFLLNEGLFERAQRSARR